MTTPREFVAAMVRRPNDRVLPLVYADWLEEAGQAERAEWVRLGVQLTETAAADDGAIVGQRRRLWQRLRPAYWGRVFGPDRRDPAAFVRVRLGGSAGALRLLGGAAWPTQALADGWLGEVEARGTDLQLPQVVAAWAGSLAGVPLALGVASYDRSDAAADRLFRQLAELSTLTRLRLYYADVTATTPRPRDEYVLRLAALPHLRALTMVGAADITAAAAEALAAGLPGVALTVNGVSIPGGPGA